MHASGELAACRLAFPSKLGGSSGGRDGRWQA
jgi:hypothetical protein